MADDKVYASNDPSYIPEGYEGYVDPSPATIPDLSVASVPSVSAPVDLPAPVAPVTETSVLSADVLQLGAVENTKVLESIYPTAGTDFAGALQSNIGKTYITDGTYRVKAEALNPGIDWTSEAGLAQLQAFGETTSANAELVEWNNELYQAQHRMMGTVKDASGNIVPTQVQVSIDGSPAVEMTDEVATKITQSILSGELTTEQIVVDVDKVPTEPSFFDKLFANPANVLALTTMFASIGTTLLSMEQQKRLTKQQQQNYVDLNDANKDGKVTYEDSLIKTQAATDIELAAQMALQESADDAGDYDGGPGKAVTVKPVG